MMRIKHKTFDQQSSNKLDRSGNRHPPETGHFRKPTRPRKQKTRLLQQDRPLARHRRKQCMIFMHFCSFVCNCSQQKKPEMWQSWTCSALLVVTIMHDLVSLSRILCSCKPILDMTSGVWRKQRCIWCHQKDFPCQHQTSTQICCWHQLGFFLQGQLVVFRATHRFFECFLQCCTCAAELLWLPHLFETDKALNKTIMLCQLRIAGLCGGAMRSNMLQVPEYD